MEWREEISWGEQQNNTSSEPGLATATGLSSDITSIYAQPLESSARNKNCFFYSKII